MNHAIRYLEWCTDERKNETRAIHNYLLALYAKLPDETRILRFLEKSRGRTILDLKYALRLCTQEGKQRACVAIYNIMELYEEAVELALEVGGCTAGVVCVCEWVRKCGLCL